MARIDDLEFEIEGLKHEFRQLQSQGLTAIGEPLKELREFLSSIRDLIEAWPSLATVPERLARVETALGLDREDDDPDGPSIDDRLRQLETMAGLRKAPEKPLVE